MNFGLVGWGIASGNGGMNTDIAVLAPWVTHWLVVAQPNIENHDPYLTKASSKVEIIHCKHERDHGIYDKFLDKIDGLLYIEHPIIKNENDYDIVHEAKKKGKLVVGIPMWEWWPERKRWALETDILWAVTKFTNRYLKSLSDILYVHGYQHNWRGRVIGDVWGVNLDDFPYRKREKIEKIVFINGNGGYKLRKASDIVFEAFIKPGAPPLKVYTQLDNIAKYDLTSNIEIIDKTFPDRKDVYTEGDLFLFPSYWEGLCHGIYEAQASGGLVITTDHEPMNECGTNLLLPVDEIMQEDLSGKKILKTAASAEDLYKICKSIFGVDFSEINSLSITHFKRKYDLKENLKLIYIQITHLA